MIPTSFPSTSCPLHKIFIVPLTFHNIPHTNSIYHHRPISSTSTNLSIFRFNRSRHHKETRSLPLLVSRGSNNGDNKAMETVLRLYEAIKNKNLNEMSDIIGHDCQCACSVASTSQTINGKKQVMEFFSSLTGNLGNNIEFVVQPSMQDGMTVGVSWKLECCKTHKPLGKGFSVHMCHIYEGKVLIRNVEMFLEPLLHIDPQELKMMGFVASILGQMASQAIFKSGKKKACYFMCSLVTFVILFLLIRLYSS